MTRKEAEGRAAAIGLSAWVTQAIAVGRKSDSGKSKVIDLYCVGFSSIDLPLGEAESWEEAFDVVLTIIK
jgi:hypothetical protein